MGVPQLPSKPKKETMLVRMICNKCGKEQKKDKGKSNKNWDYYPTKPCECGGEFEIKVES